MATRLVILAGGVILAFAAAAQAPDPQPQLNIGYPLGKQTYSSFQPLFQIKFDKPGVPAALAMTTWIKTDVDIACGLYVSQSKITVSAVSAADAKTAIAVKKLSIIVEGQQRRDCSEASACGIAVEDRSVGYGCRVPCFSISVEDEHEALPWSGKRVCLNN